MQTVTSKDGTTIALPFWTAPDAVAGSVAGLLQATAR
jgi:hypothetical protein